MPRSDESLARATQWIAACGICLSVLTVAAFMFPLSPPPRLDGREWRCGTSQAGAVIVSFLFSGCSITGLALLTGIARQARSRAAAWLACIGWWLFALTCSVVPVAWGIRGLAGLID